MGVQDEFFQKAAAEEAHKVARPKTSPKQFCCLFGLLIIGGGSIFFVVIFIFAAVVGSKLPPIASTPGVSQSNTSDATVDRTAHREEIEKWRELVRRGGWDGVKTFSFEGVIADVYSEPNGPPWRLTIIINEKWDALPWKTRLEYAQVFRWDWVAVQDPVPGGPQIEITIKNTAGGTVGKCGRSEKDVRVAEGSKNKTSVSEVKPTEESDEVKTDRYLKEWVIKQQYERALKHERALR